MNRCDISEEETTNALHSLYQIPLPENQHGAQYQPGINSVDQVNFNYQNVVSDYMTDGRKKLHKLNETSNKGSKAVLSSAAKNFQIDSVKKEDLNGVNSVKKSSSQHHSKSDNSKHSNRQKQEHVPGGMSFIFALLMSMLMLLLDSLIHCILYIINSLQAMLI